MTLKLKVGLWIASSQRRINTKALQRVKKGWLHGLWVIMKQKNIHSMRSLEEEEREEGVKSLFKEIKDENFPNL